jgi:hypothetical protein
MRARLLRRHARWLVPAALIVPMALASTPAALAAWSAGGSGSAGASATTMPAGNAPTGSASFTTVTISWTAAKMVDGSAVAGYVVNRFNAVNGTQATVGSACSGIVTTTTCTETSVPPGTWVYTDTPVEQNWTGGASPASNSITTRLG